MVGRTVNATFERPVDISSAKTVMKVKQISSKNKINNVSFDLHEGEILGFFVDFMKFSAFLAIL